jgi:hypothetical protein
MSSSVPALKITELHKSFDQPAVDGLSLNIKAGEL